MHRRIIIETEFLYIFENLPRILIFCSRMSSDNKDNEQLNLKVVGQDGQVIQFKIKRITPFRKLMHAYCDRSKVAQNTVRFTFDGSRINDTDTPKSMDMEDGDTIEVFTQQTGGYHFVLFNKSCCILEALKSLLL